MAVESFGVAASTLPRWRTTHSRFKIFLDLSKSNICLISKQNCTIKLGALARLILWDEVSIAKRKFIEAFDLQLKDIMDSDKPFEGKVVVFRGNFCQMLPIIQNATKEMKIEASFVNSSLWNHLEKIYLIENMIVILDKPFCHFLLRVGKVMNKKMKMENIFM